MVGATLPRGTAGTDSRTSDGMDEGRFQVLAATTKWRFA